MYYCAKWCINDSCNLSCPFCLMDNHYKTLPLQDQFRVVDKLYEMGVKSIDFFGKEVLFDTRIFDILDHMREEELHFNFSLITNGVNLKKYTSRLLKYTTPCLVNVTVSYDFGVSRTFIPEKDIMLPFKKEGVYTEFSIDVQKENLDKILSFAYEAEVDSIYLKPIMPYGSRSDYSTSVQIEKEDLVNLLSDLDTSGIDKDIRVNIPFQFSPTWEYEYDNIEVFTDPECTCGDMLYINSEGRAYGCGILANTNSDLWCDFLTTPIENIESCISCRGKRECIV